VVGLAVFDSKTVQHDVTLTPGPYALFTAGGYVLGPSGSPTSVVVENDGTIDYDASLNLAYQGRGTTALSVTGVPIHVDTSAHPGQSFDLVGTAWFSGSPTLQLAPGTYAVDSQASGQMGAVTVQPAGVIDYDPSLNKSFSGLGTSTLTLL
jgi:hypothetical protein